MTDTEAALLAAIERMCADRRIGASCSASAADIDATRRSRDFNTAIHRGDQMLLHSLRQHRDAGAAFAQYFNIALQQHAAARQLHARCVRRRRERRRRARFRVRLRTPAALPFAVDGSAAASGRRICRPKRRFRAHAFGVQRARFARGSGPLRAGPPFRFHLGRVAVLASAGAAVPCVAGAAGRAADAARRALLQRARRLAAAGRPALPASGLAYARESENADLATDIYGTAYASEAFVRAALRRSLRRRARLYCDCRARSRTSRISTSSPATAPRSRGAPSHSAAVRGAGSTCAVLASDGTLRAARLGRVARRRPGRRSRDRRRRRPPCLPHVDRAARRRGRIRRRSPCAIAAGRFAARPVAACARARVSVVAPTARGERALLYAGEIESGAGV